MTTTSKIGRMQINPRNHSTRSVWVGGEPRPAVVVSSSAMDPNETEMLIVVPSTRTRRPKTGELIPNHHQVDPDAKNGLTARSYFMCEQVRAISVKRLGSKLGRLSTDDLYQIDERLNMLMDLSA
jgi:mRNA-degrading endonuclease toxin of MazEF toxin-antitoxin module